MDSIHVILFVCGTAWIDVISASLSFFHLLARQSYAVLPIFLLLILSSLTPLSTPLFYQSNCIFVSPAHLLTHSLLSLFLCFVICTMRSLLCMGGDHEVSLTIKSKTPERVNSDSGGNGRWRSINRSDRRALHDNPHHNHALDQDKQPKLVFHHFACAGNRQAPEKRKSIFEKKGVSILKGEDNGNRMEEQVATDTGGGRGGRGRGTRGGGRNDSPNNDKAAAAAPFHRIPTEQLSLEDQILREEKERKERRQQRLSLMAAVLGTNKSFVLFQPVQVKDKGPGIVESKLIETGVNAGKHRVKLDGHEQQIYVYAAPAELTSVDTKRDALA